MGTLACAWPSSRASGQPSSRALRSHRAISTAEIAVAAIPGRPMLRTARIIASHEPGTSSALRPVTTPASVSVMTFRAAAAA